MKNIFKKTFAALILFGCIFIWSPASLATVDELTIEETSIARFKGSWFQIGRQIGAAYPDYILDFSKSMETALFFVGLGSGWNASTVPTYYSLIEDIVPQNIKDHMAGLAVGMTETLPISYETAWNAVLTQNMATEMLNMAKNMGTVPDPDSFEVGGCTGLAVTSDSGTFLCHNTDATDGGGDNIVLIMYWEPDNGDYGYMTIDPPGWADVNYCLNEKGIGITLNAGSLHVNAEIGMPINFMLREIMEQTSTLEEAVSVLQDYLDEGGNFGIAGALLHIVDFNNSTMAKIQVMSNELDISYGEQSPSEATYIGSANHFVGDFVVDAEFSYESSEERYKSLLSLITGTEVFDLDGCWDILADTDGGAATNNTISRAENSTATIFGNIFTKDGMYYTMGPPHAYLEKYGEAQYISFSEISTLEPKTFTARPKAFQVILEWDVHNKDIIKGYNIYRCNEQNGTYKKTNTALLTSTEYTDKWLPNRKRFYYKLEVIFNDDTKSMRSIINATPKLKYWF